jgi:hypothetical protein
MNSPERVRQTRQRHVENIRHSRERNNDPGERGDEIGGRYVQFDVSQLSAGVCVDRIQAGDITASKKLVLMNSRQTARVRFCCRA